MLKGKYDKKGAAEGAPEDIFFEYLAEEPNPLAGAERSAMRRLRAHRMATLLVKRMSLNK